MLCNHARHLGFSLGFVSPEHKPIFAEQFDPRLPRRRGCTEHKLNRRGRVTALDVQRRPSPEQGDALLRTDLDRGDVASFRGGLQHCDARAQKQEPPLVECVDREHDAGTRGKIHSEEQYRGKPRDSGGARLSTEGANQHLHLGVANRDRWNLGWRDAAHARRIVPGIQAHLHNDLQDAVAPFRCRLLHVRESGAGLRHVEATVGVIVRALPADRVLVLKLAVEHHRHCNQVGVRVHPESWFAFALDTLCLVEEDKRIHIGQWVQSPVALAVQRANQPHDRTPCLCPCHHSIHRPGCHCHDF
eukprot:m.361485 g.361485  ORF g.361485 m.361485 type:complete len:302 (-) comp28051_c0_seq1:1330-2235(-)